MKKLYILIPGNENYPDVDAYRSFFSTRGFEVYSGNKRDFSRDFPAGVDVLWCIMGLCSSRLRASFIIHDYRSLSVGKLCSLKDALKKRLNVKPDLRIFLNKQVRGIMNFKDGVPFEILDMGVPNWIDTVSASADFHATYGYLGAMSFERKFDDLFDCFLDNKAEEDTFILIGEPEAALYEKYKRHKSLNFVGRKDQREALSIIKSCELAVCYFPFHRPHKYQTPTKLLEYAALGSSIICNNSPSNIYTAKEYQIKSLFGGKYIFDGIGEVSDVAGNDPRLFKCLKWENVILDSGVMSYLS